MEKLSPEQLLAAEVEGVFREFMFMPNEHAYTVASLWVMHTHLRDVTGRFLPYVTPRLYFGSKDPGCGKSLATEITVRLSHNGEMVLEPTSPSVTTMINQDLATVGFDEIDTFFGRGTGKQAMRAILNGGYKIGSSVTRQRSDETERQNVHGPVVMNGKNANLFEHHDNFATLKSRSISIILERKPADVKVTRFNPELCEARLFNLMRRLVKWGRTNARGITNIPVDELMPSTIANRAEEIWTVLFRIASHLGGKWPTRCEAAARAFVLGEWELAENEAPCVSPSEELLVAVQSVFAPEDEFLATSVIVERLGGLRKPPSLMDEWQNPRSAEMGIARTLGGVFGAEKVRRQVEGVQSWGYTREELEVPDSEPVVLVSVA